MVGVEVVVHTAVVTSVGVGRGNGCCRLRSERDIPQIQVLHQAQFGEGAGLYRDRGVLTETLPREEAKVLVFNDGPAEASAELLTFELRRGIAGVQLVVRIERG